MSYRRSCCPISGSPKPRSPHYALTRESTSEQLTLMIGACGQVKERLGGGIVGAMENEGTGGPRWSNGPRRKSPEEAGSVRRTARATLYRFRKPLTAMGHNFKSRTESNSAAPKRLPQTTGIQARCQLNWKRCQY